DHECSKWRGNSLRHCFAWVHAANGFLARWRSSAYRPSQELSGPHQNVTVNENATPTIEFEMRVRRHTAKAKPTPTPSFLGKVGGSLKHLFGGNSTPPPRRKR